MPWIRGMAIKQRELFYYKHTSSILLNATFPARKVELELLQSYLFKNIYCISLDVFNTFKLNSFYLTCFWGRGKHLLGEVRTVRSLKKWQTSGDECDTATIRSQPLPCERRLSSPSDAVKLGGASLNWLSAGTPRISKKEEGLCWSQFVLSYPLTTLSFGLKVILEDSSVTIGWSCDSTQHLKFQNLFPGN